MEAKELRIGNWVRYDGWHPDLVAKNRPIIPYDTQIEYIELDDYEGEDVYVIGSTHIRAFIDSYSLIPLTEEWLIKFSFKKENNTIYSISDKLSSSEVGKWYFFKNENNSFTPHIKRENKFSWIGKEIKYVHQLQNLYFALTGEELGLQVSPSYI